MWGAKIWQRRDLIEGLMRALIISGQQQVKSQDQFSLADIVWPIAKYDVVRKLCIRFNEQWLNANLWECNRWLMTLMDAKTNDSSGCHHWKSIHFQPNAMAATMWGELDTNYTQTSAQKFADHQITRTGNIVDENLLSLNWCICCNEVGKHIHLCKHMHLSPVRL